MSIVLCIFAGIVASVGAYLLMQRNLTRVILGVAMFGHAVNLVILTSGSRAGDAPIVDDNGLSKTGGVIADPVPQALILTAIVIGFAVVAFLLSIAYRGFTIDGNDIVEDDLYDRLVKAEGEGS